MSVFELDKIFSEKFSDETRVVDGMKGYLHLFDKQQELFEIFIKFCEDYDYVLDSEARLIVKQRIMDMERNKGYNFANATGEDMFFMIGITDGRKDFDFNQVITADN